MNVEAMEEAGVWEIITEEVGLLYGGVCERFVGAGDKVVGGDGSGEGGVERWRSTRVLD